MIHKLKIWPEYYNEILTGKKTFEIRKTDKDYKVGDTLYLQEYNPKAKTENRDWGYTGNEMQVEVTYILTDDNPFINIDGFVIMSIAHLPF